MMRGLFGAIPPAPTAGGGEIDDIRNLMLACIRKADTVRFPDVVRRIRCAPDAEALWFLRGDLMAVLANTRGESAAFEVLERISDMFANLLPEGLRSCPRLLDSKPRH